MKNFRQKNKLLLMFLLININYSLLKASENPLIDINLFSTLPVELKKIIFNYTFSRKNISYIVNNYTTQRHYNEDFFIPYTIRSINLVQPVNDNNVTPLPATISGDAYSFDVQLGFTNLTQYIKNGYTRCSLYKDTECHTFITSRLLPDSDSTFFDGMNSLYSGVLAQTSNCSFVIYFMNPHYQKNTCFKVHSPIYQDNGYLRSLMLHPEEDKIVFSAESDYHQKRSTLSIVDISSKSDGYNFNITARTSLPFSIKKTIYLGKQTYLAMTIEGKLVILWQDQAEMIRYAQQKHESTIVDIAVDNTVTTEKGFHPHIAFLNDKNELFVCNLLAFAQPILFFIQQIKHQNQLPFRLFYDKGQCGILYKEGKTYKDFVVWPDNLLLLCAAKSLHVQNASKLLNH